MVITSRTRNAVVGKPARGFESHPLRNRRRRAYAQHMLCVFVCVHEGGMRTPREECEASAFVIYTDLTYNKVGVKGQKI